MISYIPINNAEGSSYFEKRISLDGRDYILRFLFNTREEKWYLDINDQDNVPIVSGLKLVLNIDLVRRLTDERRPKGALHVFENASSNEQQIDPGLSSLGLDIQLVYFDEEEIS